ncbi:hypothetical protein [Polaromonas hydrogenivorans]|uniref:Uncharacterized protein n=1 Tax=Polaromonas hydrogenivorans TaxID=335476 RepID=A0AAU7LZZ6_9BURK
MEVYAAVELFVCVNMTLAQQDSPACSVPQARPPEPQSHVIAVGARAASMGWRWAASGSPSPRKPACLARLEALSHLSVRAASSALG